MAEKKRPNPKALLRTRWREILADGSMARLRSEGRLVALYVLSVADWSTCLARFTMRRAAKGMGVHPTTVRRGIAQMVQAGILQVLDKPGGNGKTSFLILGRAPLVRTPDTARARGCAPLVRTPDTSGARSGHGSCAQRAPLVRAPDTGCAHSSVLLSGSPVRTSESSSTADAGAGRKPARRRRPSRWIEGMPPPDAAAEAQEGVSVDAGDTITQEVDA
jgi:hypothetical protein